MFHFGVFRLVHHDMEHFEGIFKLRLYVSQLLLRNFVIKIVLDKGIVIYIVRIYEDLSRDLQLELVTIVIQKATLDE